MPFYTNALRLPIEVGALEPLIVILKSACEIHITIQVEFYDRTNVRKIVKYYTNANYRWVTVHNLFYQTILYSIQVTTILDSLEELDQNSLAKETDSFLLPFINGCYKSGHQINDRNYTTNFFS